MPSTTSGICRTRSNASIAFAFPSRSFASTTCDASMPRRGVGCFLCNTGAAAQACPPRRATSATGSSARNARRLCNGPCDMLTSLLRRGHRLVADEAPEKIIHSVPCIHPAAVQHRLVGVVRNDDQLVIDVPRPQQLHEPDGLAELHVP